MEGILTGYILPDSGIDPVQVWVPAIDGWFALGSTRTIGYNMLNSIGSKELAQMRSKCSYYYLSQTMNSGNYRYNSIMGAGTTEEFLPKERETSSLPDLNKGDFKYKYNGRANQKSFSLGQSNPISWMCSQFTFDREKGTVPNSGANYQNGEFVKMTRWQRVLVTRVDGGATGVVLGVLPWADDYNSVLESQKK